MNSPKNTLQGKAKKKERHEAILNLLRANKKKENITQDWIKNRLLPNFPDVHQTTIGRDLIELGFEKDPVSNIYTLKDPSGRIESKLKDLHNQLARCNAEISSCEHMFSIRITGGMENYVATILKDIYQERILGTISGSDVLIIITNDPKLQSEISKYLNKFNSTI